MPRIKVETPQAEQTPEYILTVKLIAEFRQTWVDQMREAGVDPVTYSRLSVIAMTQVASIVAVDIGMNSQQFGTLCVANFNEALKKAPRFT